MYTRIQLAKLVTTFAASPGSSRGRSDRPQIDYCSRRVESPQDQSNAADLRDRIVQELVQLFSAWGAADAASLRAEFAPLLEAATSMEREVFWSRLESTGATWGYHPPDPLARRVSRTVHALVLAPGSELQNANALEVASKRPVLLLGNHLSFIDANVLDYLMYQAGYSAIAEHMTVLVGPKVYTDPVRRLASLCFGTIKLAQSTSRASGHALLPKRKVARLAMETFHIARERLSQGDHLLIFVEGTRSRTSAMQRALPAVARYLEGEGALLLPWGIFGTEHLLPIGAERACPARVTARIGTPVEARDLLERCDGSRALAMDTIGFLIAELLPPSHRDVYDSSNKELARAREIASALTCRA